MQSSKEIKEESPTKLNEIVSNFYFNLIIINNY